jgi:hypothetical protein
VGIRKGVGEGLTGEHAGRVLSREKLTVRGADAVEERCRRDGLGRNGEVRAVPGLPQSYRMKEPSPAAKHPSPPSGQMTTKIARFPQPLTPMVYASRMGRVMRRSRLWEPGAPNDRDGRIGCPRVVQNFHAMVTLNQ